jgi:predicted Zn-dependent peptidase
MEYNYHTLSNGIRIVHKNTSSNVAHAGIVINTGSRDEDENEHGMAHFLEHTVFKGTEKRKVYHVLSRLENIGADLNAYTTKEETVIYASFLNEYYDRSLELISDITFNSTFPEKELEKEKDVIRDEIDSYKDSPAEMIFDDFEDLIFAGHPIGRNILGTKKTLKAFNKEKVLNFVKNNYHTDQMTICSVGKIPFSTLIKKVEKYFGGIPANYRSKKREPFTNYKVQRNTVKKSTYQSHCIIGNRAFDYSHSLKPAFTLLTNILGGPGLNSRLNLGIREKYGFAYNIEAHYTPYTDTGIFLIYLGTAFGYADKSVELVYKELEKLRNKKLGNIQLSNAKKQFIGQMAITYDSNLNEMLSIGKSYLHYNKVDTIEELNKKVELINSEDILEAANIVFSPETMSQLIYKKRGK